MKANGYKVKMKLSNKLLLGAGILICVLILSVVISTRVVFDREIKPHLGEFPAYTYIYTNKS
jgi:hypothetical protein